MTRAGKWFLCFLDACSVTWPLLFCSLALHAAYGQTPETESQPITQLRVESNLVTVRVVVRDAHGKPIEGLTKEDFKLLDRGKEQLISQFEAISSNATEGVPASGGAAGNAPESGPAQQRFLVIYFDNIDITDAELIQAREAADSYLTHNLRPTDQVAIVTSDAMLIGFTSDPQKLHAALASLHRSPHAPQRVGQCPQISPYQALEILSVAPSQSGHDPAWVLALEQANHCIGGGILSSNPENDENLKRRVLAQAQDVASNAGEQARGAMQTLEAVTKYLAQAPGQRAVIVVSHGFLSESEQVQLDGIIESALKSQIVINSLDPKGLTNMMRSMDASRDDAATTNQRANTAMYSLDAAQQFQAADVLSELAQGTGGQFFHNDNDLKAGFDMLAGHPSEYALAFSPKDLKHDGKFHEIKVQLREKQKGVTLQARHGYFASSGQRTASITTPEIPAAPSAAAQPQPTQQASSQPAQQATPQAPQQPASQPSSAQTAQTQAQSAPPPEKKGKLFSAYKAKKITVDQLEQFLAKSHDQPDLALADALKGFELTERLNTPERDRLQSQLPGPESRIELAALGDRSAFLPLPKSEIADGPALSAEEQHTLLALARKNVDKTIARLPNLLASRQSALFADKPATHSSMSFEPGEPLHYIKTSTASVVYRNGKEKLDSNTPTADTGKGRSNAGKQAEDASDGDLASSGQFGPVLARILSDAAQREPQWGYWQKADKGDLAVFRYSVPRKSSHYNVQVSSTVYAGFAAYQVKERPGYHGEMAIDPTDGKIARLTIQADLPSDGLMTKADLSVEYGSVQLDGQEFLCPVHSVALVMAYTTPIHSRGHDSSDSIPEQDSMSQQIDRERISGAPQTMLSDIVFRDYHLFGSDVRIITGNPSTPDGNAP